MRKRKSYVERDREREGKKERGIRDGNSTKDHYTDLQRKFPNENKGKIFEILIKVCLLCCVYKVHYEI